MVFDAGELPFDIDLTFEVGQILRRVFKLTQNKKGDVYLRIISGIRRGESANGSIIGEDRISLHASKISPHYNTFKKTYSTEDGATDVAVQLNTAIKSGEGFAHLTSVMFSDLAATRYDVDPSKKEEALVIGEFDPNQSTACCAVFAGALGVEFNCGKVPFDFFKINTALFQIVIVAGKVSIPALSYSRSFCFETLPPDAPFLGRRERARRLQRMQASTPEDCLKTFSEHIPKLLSYRYDYLRVSLTEHIVESERMLQSAAPEEIPLLDAVILEARNTLNKMTPPKKYLHVKDRSNAIRYLNDKGEYDPL